MMKQIDKRLLLRYILINIAASSLLVLLLWYTGKFIKGILSYINLVLYLPSFFILVLLKGLPDAVHFTTFATDLMVSFIFYSAIIALIQMSIYKFKKMKKDKDKIKNTRNQGTLQ